MSDISAPRPAYPRLKYLMLAAFLWDMIWLAVARNSYYCILSKTTEIPTNQRELWPQIAWERETHSGLPWRSHICPNMSYFHSSSSSSSVWPSTSPLPTTVSDISALICSMLLHVYFVSSVDKQNISNVQTRIYVTNNYLSLLSRIITISCTPDKLKCTTDIKHGTYRQGNSHWVFIKVNSMLYGQL